MSYVMNGMGAAPDGESCELACYEAKSADYQACQKLPVADRGKKVACFKAADKQLQSCLSKCNAPSAATIAVAAGVGLLVLELSK